MPPTPSTDRGDKRERILEAALTLFAERGFHGTAVPLVAERAGVGAGTIYRYFESKEALVNALYQHWKRAAMSAVLDGFPFTAPPREQFHQLFRRFVAFARESPAAFAFLELHHHADYLDAESLAMEQQAMSMAHVFLEQTRAQRITRDADPGVLIAVVLGGIVRLLRHHAEGQLALDEQQLEQAEHVLWECVRQ